MKSYSKEKNELLWEKKRVKYVKEYPFMIGLDKGSDGRLFWKVWDAETYRKFRGKPLFVCSYWNDKEVKKFYWEDLRNPIALFVSGIWQGVMDGEQLLLLPEKISK